MKTKKKPWTEEEVALLKTEATARAIAEQLNRSEASVRAKRTYSAARTRAYRAENKEAWNSYQRDYRAENPERSRAWDRKCTLKKRYGMTVEQYEKLVRGQQGLCACCSRQMILKGQKSLSVCVDHDHSTGKVRALLCTGCNVGIAQFGEDPERCELAAKYLRKHKRQ